MRWEKTQTTLIPTHCLLLTFHPANQITNHIIVCTVGVFATVIQRVFRGFRVRLRLSRVEKYVDEDSDLEDLDDDFLYDERQLALDIDAGPAIRMPDKPFSSRQSLGWWW